MVHNISCFSLTLPLSRSPLKLLAFHLTFYDQLNLIISFLAYLTKHCHRLEKGENATFSFFLSLSFFVSLFFLFLCFFVSLFLCFFVSFLLSLFIYCCLSFFLFSFFLSFFHFVFLVSSSVFLSVCFTFIWTYVCLICFFIILFPYISVF